MYSHIQTIYGGCHCFMIFFSLSLISFFVVAMGPMFYYSLRLYHPQLLLSALHFSSFFLSLPPSIRTYYCCFFSGLKKIYIVFFTLFYFRFKKLVDEKKYCSVCVEKFFSSFYFFCFMIIFRSMYIVLGGFLKQWDFYLLASLLSFISFLWRFSG